MCFSVEQGQYSKYYTGTLVPTKCRIQIGMWYTGRLVDTLAGTHHIGTVGISVRLVPLKVQPVLCVSLRSMPMQRTSALVIYSICCIVLQYKYYSRVLRTMGRLVWTGMTYTV